MESKRIRGLNRHLAGLCLILLLAASGPGPVQAQNAAGAEALQSDFDSAMQAVEQDRLRTARERLTSLLSANPSLSRARLELARVNYLSRDYAAARSEAQRVLDDPDTPPTVRATVLAFLAQIDADEARYAARHLVALRLRGACTTQRQHGPAGMIDIGGIDFTVAPASQKL
jgi:Tfp pilus assembly protein PilF